MKTNVNNTTEPQHDAKVSVMPSVCVHPFDSLEIDKKLKHHYCKKCSQFVYKQTEA
jgi:RNase P subunit RPR2